MKRARIFAAAALATLLGLGLWGFVVEPASLVTREYDLSLPRWSADLAGMRVAVLTDLHVGSPFNGIDKLEKIVALTNSLEPDLIVIPGDLVIHGVPGGTFVEPEAITKVLGGLKAPLGVWACLGNHDWWLDGRRVIAALEKERIGVLEDRAVQIRRGGAHFWLVGISDFWEGRHDFRKALAQVGDEAPVLMFTHNPDVFPDIPGRFSLLIAGHTHGGQVSIPLLGPPVVPSEFGQRYARGHVVEGGRHLFVSSGIGTSILPVRLGVPPEITVLKLEPEKAASP